MVRRRGKTPLLTCGEMTGLRCTGCPGERHPPGDGRLRGGSGTEGSASCCGGLMVA